MQQSEAYQQTEQIYSIDVFSRIAKLDLIDCSVKFSKNRSYSTVRLSKKIKKFNSLHILWPVAYMETHRRGLLAVRTTTTTMLTAAVSNIFAATCRERRQGSASS